MEGRVEAADLRQMRMGPRQRVDRRQVVRQVQRGERDQRVQPGQHGGVDSHGVGEVLAAMDDAVADCAQGFAGQVRLEPVQQRGEEILLCAAGQRGGFQRGMIGVRRREMGLCAYALDLAAENGGARAEKGEFQAA